MRGSMRGVREHCVSFAGILKSKQKQYGGKPFKMPFAIYLAYFDISCFYANGKKRKCIVCHKSIDKKLETTRSSLQQQHELEACFSVSYDEPGTLCSTCRRALYRYKKTGKTFFNVRIFIDI